MRQRIRTADVESVRAHLLEQFGDVQACRFGGVMPPLYAPFVVERGERIQAWTLDGQDASIRQGVYLITGVNRQHEQVAVTLHSAGTLNTVWIVVDVQGHESVDWRGVRALTPKTPEEGQDISSVPAAVVVKPRRGWVPNWWSFTWPGLHSWFG